MKTMLAKNSFFLLALVLASFLLSPGFISLYAAEESEDTGKANKDEEEEEKTIAETVKDFEKIEGLFTLYRNPKNGELMMEILPEQLQREYIYFSYSENGVVAAGHFRGSYEGQAIFQLRKYYNKIEFVEKNTSFYFDPENPLVRASDANISAAVLASTKIVATTENNDRYLIKLDDILLNESLQKLTPNPDPDKKPHEQFALGKLSKDKTRYADVRAYPENINIQVDYVYDNESPYIRGGEEVTDPRSITLTLQHSFLAVPDNMYKARFDDSRVGYFLDQVTDLTSHEIAPYRDLINRWNLQKKNPLEEVSEPVEPITWWIENTTPYAYRDAIRAGVLAWNEAFEQAGFRNAIVVKLQPDDASWDAGDIRYNVLRWTSSPNPPFGGYGPAFTNPRTGQILGADIMLEDVFVSNRMRMGEIFGSYGIESDGPARGLPGGDRSLKNGLCSVGAGIQHDLMLARSAMAALGDMSNKDTIVEEALYELALHEVGHTLGLSHNMRSSQLHSNENIHNPSVTDGILIGSVMDYAPINLAPPGQEQGNFFTTKPGPYDTWAIQFGYDTEMVGHKRIAHLARSTEAQLAFGNDADDMRSPGKAIDPRVNVNDMSSDAIAYAEGRFSLVDEVLLNLKEKLTSPGQGWEEIRNAYLVLTTEQFRQAAVVSRYIGGVYVDRSLAGDREGESHPYRPVPEERQRQAMSVLNKRIFSADAFNLPADLISHLAMQRRGFAHFNTTEDPKIHNRVLTIQKDILDHLLHPVVLSRITDTTLYGNTYDISHMFADLTAAIFEADLNGDINTFRQNLQVEYTQRLLKIVKTGSDNQYDNHSRSVALSEVERIESWMKKYRKRYGDQLSQATRNFVLHLIERSREKNG
jgi:hypothetical protein